MPATASSISLVTCSFQFGWCGATLGHVHGHDWHVDIGEARNRQRIKRLHADDNQQDKTRAAVRSDCEWTKQKSSCPRCPHPMRLHGPSSVPTAAFPAAKIPRTSAGVPISSSRRFPGLSHESCLKPSWRWPRQVFRRAIVSLPAVRCLAVRGRRPLSPARSCRRREHRRRPWPRPRRRPARPLVISMTWPSRIPVSIFTSLTTPPSTLRATVPSREVVTAERGSTSPSLSSTVISALANMPTRAFSRLVELDVDAPEPGVIVERRLDQANATSRSGRCHRPAPRWPSGPTRA